MTNVGYWIAVTAAFVLIGFVVVRLLNEIRQSNQLWRSRVTDLERERDGLIGQVAAAQGVAIEGASSKTLRSEWSDPENGNVYFSDGEIRDAQGNVLMDAGSGTVNPDLPNPFNE